MKPIKDIRYYECPDVPGPAKALPSSGTQLLDIPAAAHRIGQRVACMLGAERFSVGAHDHVYVAFTPALADGVVEPTGFGLESWHRYVAYGMSRTFKSLPEPEKLRRIQSATFDILRALVPENHQLLDDTCERLTQHGPRTRILRAVKDTKAHRFEVWFDVPPLHEPAFLYVLARDNVSGQWLEAPPLPLTSYDDAFPLIASMSFTRGVLTLNPRKSFRAGLSTKAYPSPITFSLSRFSVQPRALEDATR